MGRLGLCTWRAGRLGASSDHTRCRRDSWLVVSEVSLGGMGRRDAGHHGCGEGLHGRA